MPIATLDAVIAGAQSLRFCGKVATPTLVVGRPHSLAYLAGTVGAFSAGANTAGGVVLSSSSSQVPGQIPHFDPGSGKSYLSRFLGGFGSAANQSGVLLLCDRLIDVAAISAATAISVTATTSQTINSSTLPARDNADSTNGDGVLWAMEVSTILGAGAGNAPTLGYTNQAGTSGHSTGLIDPYVAASAVGAFYRFGLQAGDTGIQSVQTFQNSATMTSGVIHLIGYRILAALPLLFPGLPNALDAVSSGFPEIPNGAVPFLVFIPSATTAATIYCQYGETQG